MKFIKIAALSVLASIMGVANYSTAIASDLDANIPEAKQSETEKLLLKALQKVESVPVNVDSRASFSAEEVTKIIGSAGGRKDCAQLLGAWNGSYAAKWQGKEVQKTGEGVAVFGLLKAIASKTGVLVEPKATDFRDSEGLVGRCAAIVDGLVEYLGLGSMGLALDVTDAEALRVTGSSLDEGKLRSIVLAITDDYAYSDAQDEDYTPVQKALDDGKGMKDAVTKEVGQACEILGLQPQSALEQKVNLTEEQSKETDQSKKETMTMAVNALNAFFELKTYLVDVYNSQRARLIAEIKTAVGEKTGGLIYSATDETCIDVGHYKFDSERKSTDLREIADAVKNDDYNYLETALDGATVITRGSVVSAIQGKIKAGEVLASSDKSQCVIVPAGLESGSLRDLIALRDKVTPGNADLFSVISGLKNVKPTATATLFDTLFTSGYTNSAGTKRYEFKKELDNAARYAMIVKGNAIQNADQRYEAVERMDGVSVKVLAKPAEDQTHDNENTKNKNRNHNRSDALSSNIETKPANNQKTPTSPGSNDLMNQSQKPQNTQPPIKPAEEGGNNVNIINGGNNDDIVIDDEETTNAAANAVRTRAKELHWTLPTNVLTKLETLKPDAVVANVANMKKGELLKFIDSNQVSNTDTKPAVNQSNSDNTTSPALNENTGKQINLAANAVKARAGALNWTLPTNVLAKLETLNPDAVFTGVTNMKKGELLKFIDSNQKKTETNQSE